MRFLVLLLGLAVLAFPQNPNTAVYPDAIADDEDLLVASPLATGSLASAIDDSTLTIPLGDASTFTPPMIIDIGGERIKICSKATNTLTACSGGRGFQGTTATIHAAAASVNGYVTSYQMNQITSEIKAIETALGALGLSGGARQFVKQPTLGGTLSVSTITDADLPETHTMDHDSIGVTSTDALILQNSTAAAAGAQQWSPRIRFTAQGWKTDATAESQTGDWIIENQMIQDDTKPATELVFSSRVNGGSYNPHLIIREWDDGQTPAAPSGYVEVTGTSTRAGSANIDALTTKLFANPSGNTSGYFEGTSAFVQAQGSSDFTSTFGGIIGHGAWTEGNQTGTITSMVGYQAYADLENTGSVTTLKFFEALTPETFDSGTFGTVYGLYVRAQTAGVSDNFSIFTETGNAEINTGAAGTVGLRIDGAGSQTANLQEWRNSTPAVVASVGPSGVISSAVGTSSGNVATIDGTQSLQNKTLVDPSVDDVLTFLESAGDATCGAGDYWIKGNSTTSTLRGCENGTAFSLNTSSAAYATIDYEDTPLTQRSTLNFEGSGVTCADDTTQTTCTISGGSSSGTFAGIMNDVMDWYAANNADDMDHKIVNGDFIALIHHDLNGTSGFLSPTNALHTVTTGRKAVVLKVSANNGVYLDSGNRSMRLYNTTDTADVISISNYVRSIHIPDSESDAAGGGKLPEVAAEKAIELQTWNGAASSRRRGGFVILKEVDVP